MGSRPNMEKTNNNMGITNINVGEATATSYIYTVAAPNDFIASLSLFSLVIVHVFVFVCYFSCFLLIFKCKSGTINTN